MDLRFGGQPLGQRQQRRQRTGFAAEAQMRRKPRRIQQSHGSVGEPLRRLGRIGDRQLQHDVDSQAEGHFRPGPLVDERRLAALQEIAAHDGDDRLGAG